MSTPAIGNTPSNATSSPAEKEIENQIESFKEMGNLAYVIITEIGKELGLEYKKYSYGANMSFQTHIELPQELFDGLWHILNHKITLAFCKPAHFRVNGLVIDLFAKKKNGLLDIARDPRLKSKLTVCKQKMIEQLKSEDLTYSITLSLDERERARGLWFKTQSTINEVPKDHPGLASGTITYLTDHLKSFYPQLNPK